MQFFNTLPHFYQVYFIQPSTFISKNKHIQIQTSIDVPMYTVYGQIYAVVCNMYMCICIVYVCIDII